MDAKETVHLESERLLRVTIIGPVVPFRGGIAQHTTRLANALGEYSEVTVESFSRLYPNWLYPGRFQKDTDESLSIKATTSYDLDTMNPLSWLRALGRARKEKPDLVVIPWWTFFLAPVYGFIARRLKNSSVPVLFVCHNVADHDGSHWHKTLSRFVLQYGAGFIMQAHEEAKKVRSLLGDVPMLVHPHPVYDQFPEPLRALPRRASLELLFYGFIRPYKGLDILIAALAQLHDVSFHLSIVGEPWGSTARHWVHRLDEAGLSAKVEFVPRYVNSVETAEYFERADAVVLPYRTATGTGIVATAFHYRKPVIGSNVGGIADVVQDNETGRVVPPDDPTALADAIRDFAENGIPDLQSHLDAAVRLLSWDSLASAIISKAVELRKI